MEIQFQGGPSTANDIAWSRSWRGSSVVLGRG